MEGILIVNKPQNLTSRDVVNKLNHFFSEKRIGHTGTLDPLATGVLVILIGKYTKLVPKITSLDKEYIAQIKLGIRTDTLDIEGKVLEEKECQVTKNLVLKVFRDLIGDYEEEIPAYSAVKIAGQKLYEYARKNEKIDLPKRMVKIYSLELLKIYDDKIEFKAKVSKGTYIRSLIKEITERLNVIGTMSNLKRVKQGTFEIKDAYTLDDIEKGNYKLVDIESVFKYKTIFINEENRKIFQNGNQINLAIGDGFYFIKDEKRVMAIYEFINGTGKVDVML